MSEEPQKETRIISLDRLQEVYYDLRDRIGEMQKEINKLTREYTNLRLSVADLEERMNSGEE